VVKASAQGWKVYLQGRGLEQSHDERNRVVGCWANGEGSIADAVNQSTAWPQCCANVCDEFGDEIRGCFGPMRFGEGGEPRQIHKAKRSVHLLAHMPGLDGGVFCNARPVPTS